MLLQVPVQVDSTTIHNWMTNSFPGISPIFVAIIAGYLATRAIWVLKLILMLFAKIPALTELLTKVKIFWGGDPNNSEVKGWGWLINPILMMVMSYFATGGKWDQSALLTVLGIGVREWLIKSPIPTTTKELKKLKAAFILPIALFSGLLIAESTTAGPSLVGIPQSLKITSGSTITPWQDRLLFSVGCGYQKDYQWEVSDQDRAFLGLKVGWLLNGKFAIQTESTWLYKNYGSIRAGLWFSP